jgi:serine protease
MPSSPLLLASALYTASAGVSVEVDDPPVLEARYADGGVRIRFPGHERSVDTAGAAVVTVREGAPIPDRLRAEGTPIGAAARHWRIPTSGGVDALALSLQWAAHPDIEAAIPDLVQQKAPAASFDDPEYEGQWYLEELGMTDLFDRSLGDPDVRIGVIDSGIDIGHSDLAAGVLAPRDLVEGDDDPTPDPGDEHGTAVSGVVAARANNGTGMVGLCPECTLVPVRLLGSNTLSAEITAFEHMIEQDVAVINNSWGFVGAVAVPTALEEVINRAARESRGGLGAVVVFAAGNDSREIEDGEMQAMNRVICVSAVDRYHLPANFTNSGASVDIAAPAATVSLAPNDGITTTFGGTSSAAPVVSGIAGWLLSIAPELTAAEVRTLMRETAYQTSQVTFVDGHHPIYGFGEIDPIALLAAIEGPEEVPPDDDDQTPRHCGGCTTSTPVPSWLLGAPLALLALRRRR